MAGDLRRLRGDRDKKSVPHCIVHAGMNGLFFLTTELHCSFSSYITFTTLLHHFYITFTSLLHHSFSSYVTFTSVPSSVPFVHPTPFLNVLKTVFPAVPATPHGHAINCVPVHRFRVRRTSETGLTPAEWREFPRYALVRILMHAVKTEPARFWRVFGWFVACFTGFPSETSSEALRRCTQRMLW